MEIFDDFTTTPAGSIALLPENEIDNEVRKLHALPKILFDIAISPKTGSYLRGVEKTHGLASNAAPLIAYQILKILTGQASLSYLPAVLSTQLKIANDKAHSIANEIEKDIIAPIALPLNHYLAQKKQQSGAGKSMAEKLQTSPPPAQKQGPAPIVKRGAPLRPQNVLNLRDQKRPPSPPPIPRK